eukprot:Skav232426  [mRNA]  locus=scaffold189:117825:125147:- [translate_table: standard]
MTKLRHKWCRCQALQQIAMQDYPGPLEVIVMDDSPQKQPTTDFPRQLLIKYFHVSRTTIGDKRNMAVAEARRSGADIICIWDDDDIFTVDRLRQQVSRMVSRSASCSSIQVAFVAILKSGTLQRCKGLPLPFENSFCFRRSWLETRPSFSNCSLGEGNVIFEALEDWYSEAQPIAGEELPFLYVRTESSTAPDDALEPYPVESMLIPTSHGRTQVDLPLLALARALVRQRFPKLDGFPDLQAMRKNWKSSQQLAVSYWNALNLKRWAPSGGVAEGSLHAGLHGYTPCELMDFDEEEVLETAEALDLLQSALEDFGEDFG